MQEAIKNVTHIGAGGVIGPSILKALIDSKEFNVTVLARPESNSTYPGAKVIKVDLTSVDAVADALKGQHAVITTIGGTSISQQKVIIDAAVKAGVKRFFPSEWGNDGGNAKMVELLPLYTEKNDVLNHVKASGLTWTAILNGPFFDWAVDVSFLGMNLKSPTAQIWDSGTNVFPTTLRSTVGLAVVAALLNPEATANKVLRISSFVISQNDLLAAVEKVTGKKYEITKVNSKEVIPVAQQALAKGDMENGLFPLLLVVTFGGDEYGTDYTAKGSDNELLGLPKVDLVDVLTKLNKGEKV